MPSSNSTPCTRKRTATGRCTQVSPCSSSFGTHRSQNASKTKAKSSCANSPAEHGPALHGGGVDALLDHMQIDTTVAELGAKGDQVQDRAAKPVQPGDLQGVTVAQQLQHEVELGPGGLGAAGGIDVDVASGDAGSDQSVHLVGR